MSEDGAPENWFDSPVMPNLMTSIDTDESDDSLRTRHHIEKHRVIVGMPVYGSMSAPAARALYGEDDVDCHIVTKYETCACDSSILVSGFNYLLAHALDLRDQGHVKYFAMIHSDVDPETGWISRLIADLTLRNAHLISVVLPIKAHQRNTTSTAIGKIDRPWGDIRYLSLDDCAKLPKTFGSRHCCGEGELLLVSTGLWLTDLTWAGWDEFQGFETVSRIVRNGDGRKVITQPEDWMMSRWLHQKKARYYATTQVSAVHIGVDGWPNWIEKEVKSDG